MNLFSVGHEDQNPKFVLERKQHPSKSGSCSLFALVTRILYPELKIKILPEFEAEEDPATLNAIEVLSSGAKRKISKSDLKYLFEDSS